MVNRRRQLIDLRTVEKNRWQTTLSPLSQRSIKAVLKLLDKQVSHLEAEIEKLNREQIALLAGLAPLNNDSGKSTLRAEADRHRQEVGTLMRLTPKTQALDKRVGVHRFRRFPQIPTASRTAAANSDSVKICAICGRIPFWIAGTIRGDLSNGP